MCINTAFAVVTVVLVGTPSALVHEHVENEAIFLQVDTLKVVVQVRTV